MKYTVQSRMMMEFPASWPRVIRGALLPLAYLGALFAPAMVLSIPYQVFHKHEVSPLAFWIATVLIAPFVLWLMYRTASYSYWSFRQGVIHVDSIVLFSGLLFAVVVIAWIYPPR